MSGSFDVFVIGAGVAGLAAAGEAAGRGLKVGLAERQMFGGLAINVNHLWPGLPDLPPSGSDLAAELMTRVTDSGVTTLFEAVSAIAGAPDGALQVVTDSGRHSAGCIIVASGVRQRELGVAGEAEFEERGVSHCADCDGPLYQGEDVVVVGGGDSALQESLVLAEFCAAVHLVHRGSSFSARAEFVKAVEDTARVAVRFNTVVESLEGGDMLATVRLRDLTSGETQAQPCKGFFPYVGLEPNTAFLPAEIRTDAGAISVNGDLETSLRNVFAIGAVRSGYGGQLTHAMADARAAVAAICARLGRA